MTTTTTTKAYFAANRWTPVFFFESGKVLVSVNTFETLDEALAHPPHDERLAVSRNCFERYHGHRQLAA